MKQPSLFDTGRGDNGRPDEELQPPDQAARDFAVDPRHDVVLEASAGTGKTRVLVDRYVRLLEEGVDPRHILAITFTRKAAAEMRERVMTTLNQRVEAHLFPPRVWARLRERMADIQISTIDAFCFALLREFPLEADVDPAFEIADETEMARFTVEALDLALRAARGLVHDDETVRLLLVRVKTPLLRDALAMLIDRRQVALPAVASFVRREPGPPTAADAGARFIRELRQSLSGLLDRSALLDDGPAAPEFQWLAAELANLEAFPAGDPVRVQHLRRRLESYFFTLGGTPRKQLAKPFTVDLFRSAEVRKGHQKSMAAFAPFVASAITHLDRDLDRLLARGLLRLLVLAVEKYEGLLEEHALLDFPGMLESTVALLERQEEFARSRLKLQARYHHLLVDEFQDTSRRQWRLIDLLIAAWAEGEGVADSETSVFIVGDRKQSIYRFRHAEVTLLDEAARRIANLRPGRTVRQAITTSFRAVPELLAFVNTLAHEMVSDEVSLEERWTFGEEDRFPVPAISSGARRDGQPVLGLIAQPTMQASAEAVAAEVVRLLDTAVVRDRVVGPRPARPEDVAILFRARAGHQYFEEALELRGVRTYVYKGLGFFDAPEVQDLQALIRFLAQPDSDLRAAEFLRSRFVRLSDEALTRLAPGFSRALIGEATPLMASPGIAATDVELLTRARKSVGEWLRLADRMPPSELLDRILRDSAYVFEIRGRRLEQARENVKKVRALIRRVESRGYATLGRLARYFGTLRAGDDSNAIVEAAGAVNLMTIHAAKGLEFPIVFVVNLHTPGRGRGGGCTVIERGPGGESQVTFGSTEATELEDQRELEELRRLMYVAATRARDRLYLAAEVDSQGRVRKGARSLASLLPSSLNALFTMAAGGGDVEWHTAAGSFAFTVCQPPEANARVESKPVAAQDVEPVGEVPDLRLGGEAAVAATVFVHNARERAEPRRPIAAGGERLVGTLVHRMFQREVDPDRDDDALLDEVATLVHPVEVVDIPDPRPMIRAAVAAYRSLRSRADVADLLASGTRVYEVPVSFLAPDGSGVPVRGTVDCLVVGRDGGFTVVEFKTGRPRPEHPQQAAIYAQALEFALGAGPVSAFVAYP